MSPHISTDSTFDAQTDLSLAQQMKQAAVSAGRLAEVATRWLGEKVVGVAVDKTTVEVHIVARYPDGFPLANLAERLRNNLEPLAGGKQLDVVVDDLMVAEDDAAS